MPAPPKYPSSPTRPSLHFENPGGRSRAFPNGLDDRAATAAPDFSGGRRSYVQTLGTLLTWTRGSTTRAETVTPPGLTPPGSVFFLCSPTLGGRTRCMGWNPSAAGTCVPTPTPGPTRRCSTGEMLFWRPETYAADRDVSYVIGFPDDPDDVTSCFLGLNKASASVLLRYVPVLDVSTPSVPVYSSRRLCLTPLFVFCFFALVKNGVVSAGLVTGDTTPVALGVCESLNFFSASASYVPGFLASTIGYDPGTPENARWAVADEDDRRASFLTDSPYPRAAIPPAISNSMYDEYTRYF